MDSLTSSLLLLVSIAWLASPSTGAPSSPVRNPHSRGIKGSAGYTCKKPLVEITVSPILNSLVLNGLILSWEIEDWVEGDWVGLYEGEPSSLSSPTLFNVSTSSGRGWVNTQVQENRPPPSDEPIFNRTCSKHWAAYWRYNSTVPVAKTCLGTNPRWMEESKDLIKGLRLDQTFIPGTHDSGSFQIVTRPTRLTRYQKYLYSQDETIMDQMIFGARYLDLRVGNYKGVWWLNHDIIRVHPLEFTLTQLKDFLRNTNEIVVVDLHRFPVGFKQMSAHDTFVSYLVKELDGFVAPAYLGWGCKLGDIWDTGRRLILSYNNMDVVSKYPQFLWPPVPQKWANTLSVDRLKEYFQNIINLGPKTQWAAMAELTPNTWSVITDKYKGLRGMADHVSRNVTEWFHGSWGRSCNAVAVDYLRSTGIVEAAIRWNKRKSSGGFCDLI